MNNYQVL